MRRGWEEAPLGELCEILDYLRKPVTKKDRVDGFVPYYGATGIQDYVEDYLFNEDLVLVGEDGAKWSSGDKTAYRISGPSWVNNHAHVLRPNRSKVTDDWLVRYLEHVDLSPYVTGVTVPKLNQAKLREIPITFPSLAEQKKIVSKIDFVFGNLSKAKQLANEKAEIINQIWQKAVSRVFTELSSSVNSQVVSLGEVTELIGGGTPRKNNPNYWIGEIPWASIRDLKERYLQKTEFCITQDAVKNSSTNVISAGNLVIATRVGLGKAVQLSQDTAINQDLRAIVPKVTNDISPNYLYYWYLTVAKEVVAAGTGATVQGVTLPFLRNLQIPIVNIERQNEVVLYLNKLRENLDLLLYSCEKAHESLGRLGKTYLEQQLQEGL